MNLRLKAMKLKITTRSVRPQQPRKRVIEACQTLQRRKISQPQVSLILNAANVHQDKLEYSTNGARMQGLIRSRSTTWKFSVGEYSSTTFIGLPIPSAALAGIYYIACMPVRFFIFNRIYLLLTNTCTQRLLRSNLFHISTLPFPSKCVQPVQLS
ncbi:unnamed protein product [Ceratitis capitata]|uniref:(Mediterranean fruit fly) hypothetical protein n=1 Tax=Ceratitis capitata TaxID=7213 RepID=A0A811UNY4_CERCA|nr:unnamed protein product [Ceratitis capitata]